MAPVLTFKIMLCALFDRCLLPHVAAIEMVNIAISREQLLWFFSQCTKEYSGNMKMPRFAENDFFVLEFEMGFGE